MPGQRKQMDVANSLMNRGMDFSAPETVEQYFRELYYLQRNVLDKKNIMGEFKKNSYNFSTAAKEFKLIEENTISILVPREEEAKQILSEIRCKGYTKSLMRKAGQYCVNVYEKNFKMLYDAGMLRAISEDIRDLYELCKEDEYTKEWGLTLKIESGMGVFY